MKKLILSIVILIVSLACNAQKVQIDANGNYYAVKAVKTTAQSTNTTFTDANGKIYPVMQSAKGKLFYVRTSKAGNEYKVYLKL